MDCFYAAVEVRDRPELAGKPVAVGGSPQGRGVIATANYEARKFGVRSAMAAAKAVKLCPQLTLIRPNFAKYKTESCKIREIFDRYARAVEPLSLDEAYLDVTEASACGGSATRIAEAIRRDIFAETKLTASAGVAPNKFIAKIASEWNKPDGLKIVRPAEIADFVRDLPIEKIWGVGRVTAAKMHAMGLRTFADLQKLSMAELTARFGSWGAELHAYARGDDERPVKSERERKSLSVENTFSNDLRTLEACLAEVDALFEDWDERLQRARSAPNWRESIKSIHVKLKFHDFQSITREAAFSSYPTAKDFKELLKRAYATRGEPVRLIGVGAKLESEKRKAPRSQLAFSLD